MKARRLTLKLHQKDVANLLAASPFSVINWENGATVPAVRFIPKIRSFLGQEASVVPTSIAEKVKVWREARGLSVKGAAMLQKVDEGTWAGWEQGRAPIRRHLTMLTSLLDLES